MCDFKLVTSFLKLEKRGELQTLPLSVIQWLATKTTFISRCVFRLLHLGKFTAWILRTEGRKRERESGLLQIFQGKNDS